METRIHRKRSRGLERTFLLLISALMAFLFFRLYVVLEKDFEEVPKRISEGSMINLNHPNPAQNVGLLLQKGFYFEDPKDIEVVRSVLSQRMHPELEKIDNIGELNKHKYDVDAEQVFASGGESYKKRVKVSRSLLGYSGDDSLRFSQEKRSPPSFPGVNNIAMGQYAISGTLYDRAGQLLPGVLVRLGMILPQDSIYSEDVNEVENLITENKNGIVKVYAVDSAKRRQLQSLTAYARTDGLGKFSFTNLPKNKAFEVIPLQPGYQFGASKGVQELEGNVSFTFYRSAHTIKLFSTKDFNNLKKEKALIVRTPDEFRQWFFIIVGCFFFCFLLVHLLLSVRSPHADQLILPVVMLLTGISFITLLSLQDPLRDRFLTQNMWRYFVGGMVIL